MVKLQIFDTAGQERFRAITASFYRGAHGIILVYDVTNRDSFTNSKQWMEDIKKYAYTMANKILIGNKIDLVEKRVVTSDEGKELARDFGISFFETSAKSSQNVEKAFYSIAHQIKERISQSRSKLPADNKEAKKFQTNKSKSNCC